MWEYRACLDRVVDGDTIDLEVDLGFRTHKNIRVRLLGVDTAETYGVSHDTEEYRLGAEQTRFVKEYLDREGEWPLIFVSKEEGGKYGRWLGDIRPRGGEPLSEALINKWPEVEV